MTDRPAALPIGDHWPTLRRLVSRCRLTSLAVSMATVDPGGSPRVSPIGSLMLDRDVPAGYYFEIMTRGTSLNLEGGARVSILAVDASKLLWLRALVSGRFPRPPAVRLLGIAGDRRTPTAQEISRWRQRVGVLLKTRGGHALWGTLEWVRDLRFDAFEPVDLGLMTRSHWGV